MEEKDKGISPGGSYSVRHPGSHHRKRANGALKKACGSEVGMFQKGGGARGGKRIPARKEKEPLKQTHEGGRT